jgi:outer membrane protein TolC
MRNLLLLLALSAGGCMLTPPGARQEQDKADTIGQAAAYTQPFANRTLPEIPDDPTWQDLLHRAFLANGDLESSYHEWQAALTRIDMASSWPNSNVQVGFETMFSRERMKTFNRTTLTAGFDPSMTLRLPQKVEQSGKIAFDAAQAAGRRFEMTKFDLQKKVLVGWLDYVRMGERIRLQRENLQLVTMLVSTAKDRIAAGGPQQDLMQAQIQQRLAENELTAMEAEQSQMRAMLNGMLARPADAPLGVPKSLPEQRLLPLTDAEVLALAAERNPDLSRLAIEVKGRDDAIRLAYLAYYPDYTPQLSLNGSASQALAMMAMLPTNLPMIRGQIKEAEAMKASSEAMLRQAQVEKGAEVVANLVALRNAERQVEFFEKGLLPRARETLVAARRDYSAGRIGFSELVEANRLTIEVKGQIADFRIEREKRLAALEALAAIDIESLSPQTPTNPPEKTPKPLTETPSSTAKNMDTTPSSGSATKAWRMVYTCPNHPEVTEEKPGDCRICGTRLILKAIEPSEKPK